MTTESEVILLTLALFATKTSNMMTEMVETDLLPSRNLFVTVAVGIVELSSWICLASVVFSRTIAG